MSSMSNVKQNIVPDTLITRKKGELLLLKHDFIKLALWERVGLQEDFLSSNLCAYEELENHQFLVKNNRLSELREQFEAIDEGLAKETSLIDDWLRLCYVFSGISRSTHFKVELNFNREVKPLPFINPYKVFLCCYYGKTCAAELKPAAGKSNILKPHDVLILKEQKNHERSLHKPVLRNSSIELLIYDYQVNH